MNKKNVYEGFLIDFDGVISKNSINIAINYIHDFINEYLPISKKYLFDYYKLNNTFPVERYVKLLFESIGLSERLQELYNGFINLYEYKEEKICIDTYFNKFIEICKSKNIYFKIFTMSNINRIIKIISNINVNINSNDIIGLNNYSKSDTNSYKMIIKKLNINPKNWTLIDDDPFALMVARLSGINTILFKTDLFKNYIYYKKYITMEINSFKELLKFLK